MDIAQLRGHVLARHQVAGVRGALATTRRLSLNDDPVALTGGLGGTRGSSNTVDALGRGAPVAGDAVGGNRGHQAGGGLHRVAGGVALGQGEMTVEGHLGAADFRGDALVRNRLLTKGLLVFSAVEVAVDLRLVALVGEALNVLADLGLGGGGTTQQMLEVQLDKAIRTPS